MTPETCQCPWNELLDAQIEALEVSRTDDLDRQKAALSTVKLARERCACVGALLLVLALEHGGLAVQKKLAKMFNGLAVGAWEKATRAQERANEALELIDMLKTRIATLTKEPDPPEPAAADPELQALEKIGKLLSEFPEAVRQRMIGYMNAKFLPAAKTPNPPPKEHP